MKHLTIAGKFLFLLWICPLVMAEEVMLYEATYEGELSGWNISLERALIKRDDTYEFRSKAKNLFASVTEQSTFQLSDGHILPHYYEYARKIFGRKTIESLRFDWENQVAVYDRSDRPKNRKEHKLDGPTLDPALYQLSLQADLANDNKDLVYDFLKRKKRKRYHFTLQTKEPLKLGNDTFKAVVVNYEDDDKSTRVWLLAEHGYIIGKIVHRDDGDTYELELAKLKINNKPLEAFYSHIATASKKSAQSLESSQSSEIDAKSPTGS